MQATPTKACSPSPPGVGRTDGGLKAETFTFGPSAAFIIDGRFKTP